MLLKTARLRRFVQTDAAVEPAIGEKWNHNHRIESLRSTTAPERVGFGAARDVRSTSRQTGRRPEPPTTERQRRKLAERVGFEPTCPLRDKTLSRRPRYDHFGTSPFGRPTLKF